MRLPCFLPLLFPPLGVVADTQRSLVSETAPRETRIPTSLFTSLERFARLVDITYCVGTTGLTEPFSCVSRCKDFPELELDTTWNTGILLSDSCGYIAVDHDTQGPDGPAIIVAFRGTYSLSNTIVDLSTIPQKYVPYPPPGDGDDDDDAPKCKNCTVHMGFWESWNNARKLVLPHLLELRALHPDYPVHLLGHSLGGAVAALAALELKVSLGWDNVVATTFGEPRVGNQALADFVDLVFDLPAGGDEATEAKDGKNWGYRRLTHVKDPVPLLPLTEWGFRPHAGEIFITKSELAPQPEDLRTCAGDSDAECSAGQEGSFGLGFPTRLQLWQLFFAHRDYFWRLGLCVPGGDPADWGRDSEL